MFPTPDSSSASYFQHLLPSAPALRQHVVFNGEHTQYKSLQTLLPVSIHTPGFLLTLLLLLTPPPFLLLHSTSCLWWDSFLKWWLCPTALSVQKDIRTALHEKPFINYHRGAHNRLIKPMSFPTLTLPSHKKILIGCFLIHLNQSPWKVIKACSTTCSHKRGPQPLC